MTWRLLPLLCLCLWAHSASADTLVAARTLRNQTVLTAADITRGTETVPGALSDPAAAIGLETRVNIYAGRPIYAQNLGPAALIERNQVVKLQFETGGLQIVTDARALERAGAGDTIRVLNLASRNTVFGTVTPAGHVIVSGTSLEGYAQ